MIWLQNFLDELGKKQELGRLYSDSQSAIHLTKNFAFHSKTKHIQLKYHFIWSSLKNGKLKLENIHKPESYKYVNESCKQGETENLLSFNWSSSMMKKIRNRQVQSGAIFQQMKQ